MSIISVIVPVYKVEPYLHRCVDSILAQTFTDFELILVDDGSPDNCGKICDQYAEKNTKIHVIHRENGGLSAARNTGIEWAFEHSDSEWLCFVDSDDWVHPRYLERLHQAATQFGVQISQCGALETTGQVQEEETQKEILCIRPEEQYCNWYDPHAWGKLYAKSIFQTIRYPVGILFEDVSIWYKILFSVDAIAILDEKLYCYFQNQEGITHSSWTSAKMSWVKAWDENVAFAKSYGDREVLKQAVNRACWVYKYEIDEIAESKVLSAAEQKKYKKLIMGRLKNAVIRYKEELKALKSYDYYYAIAFPRLYRIYWTGVGIINKFRR